MAQKNSKENPKPGPDSLGYEMWVLRKRVLKITQQEMASAIAYDSSYVSAIENNREKLSDKYLDAVKAAYATQLEAAGIDLENYKSYRVNRHVVNGPAQIGGDGATQTMTVTLAECEKELAVMKERVAQLELRLQEKDQMIKLLSKPNK